MIVETTFQPGTILAEEGKPFKQNLYIVRSGVVAIANDDSVIKANLKDADYFGDKFLRGTDGFISTRAITLLRTGTACGV
jgi:signal-transduction protein with cAMP-binding, CBS, and nucleotidyltransferase domain